MGVTIGIRREDKSEWERRVPLVPADLAELVQDSNLRFTIQPSSLRVFKDEEFRQVGVTVDESLDDADIVIAVKEIPIDLLQEKKVYLYFSHTIKAQAEAKENGLDDADYTAIKALLDEQDIVKAAIWNFMEKYIKRSKKAKG